MDWYKGDYTITTDRDRIDRAAVRRFLAASYWAAGRPADVIERSLDHSLTFGLFHDGRQVGMARVVTDFATFAWLCDVFIDPAHRGAGNGRWLLSVVMGHADLQGLRRWLLGTRDAHGLYAQFGFTELPEPARFMVRIQEPGPGR
jgi:GNAT superfamily N-acetyltransferase